MDFEIKGTHIELIKLLKATGICYSGSEAKDLVRSKKVLINGSNDERLRLKIIRGDVVECEGQKITIV